MHTNRGVRHALIIFVGARVGGGGGRHVTHSSHNSTCYLFFPFLFETLPNALTLSWNILILTFINDVLAQRMDKVT